MQSSLIFHKQALECEQSSKSTEKKLERIKIWNATCAAIPRHVRVLKSVINV